MQKSHKTSYLQKQKSYICNSSTSICQNGKYVKSIIDDLVILFGGIINAVQSGSTRTMRRNSNDKKATYMDNFYIFFAYPMEGFITTLDLLLLFIFLPSRIIYL